MIHEVACRCDGVSLVRSQARRDGGMHPTPLRVEKIGAILRAGISENLVSVYQCGAGDAQPVGRRPLFLSHDTTCFGYAASTRLAGRSVAQVAGDVSAILDWLGHNRFITAGWSSGGPHALACAALLSDRCAAAASLAGVGPFAADDLDFLAGMGAENVAEFGAALAGEQALRLWM